MSENVRLGDFYNFSLANFTNKFLDRTKIIKNKSHISKFLVSAAKKDTIVTAV